MKNLFTNLMKNTAKRTQNTGGGASRQITARFEGAQMKNTSLISGCSAVDVPMPSYGASDEHPMSTRSASDERRWNSRGWKYVVMIFAVLVMSMANIGTAWGTDYYLISGDALNTTNFTTTGTFTKQSSGVSISGIKYANVKLTNISSGGSISGQNATNKVIIYNCQTTETKIVLTSYNGTGSVWNTTKIYTISEGQTGEITPAKQCTIPASTMQNDTLIYNGTGNRTIYICYIGSSNSNYYYLNVKAIESGTALATAGEAGYSFNFNMGRLIAKKNVDGSVPNEGLTFHLGNSDYSCYSTTSAHFATSGTDYIKFSTGASPVKLEVTTNATAAYSVNKVKGYNADSAATSPTKDQATSFNLDANSTYYINPNGTNIKLTCIEFKVAVAAKAYTVTAATSTGDNSLGTVSATASSLDEGETTTITATPATGYQVTNWAVSGTSASISPSGASNATSTTLTMGTENATVTATFGPKSYTVTLNNQEADADGTESVTTTYYSSSNLTSAIAKPTKDGKVFAGYFTATNGGGVQLIDAAGNWIASAGGGSTYLDGSKNWKNDGNLTLYACWMEYASTFDIEAYVQTNVTEGSPTQTFTILGTNKLLYNLGGDTKLDNSNDATGQYDGLIIKRSGDYVIFLVQAGYSLSVKWGYVKSSKPKYSINGGTAQTFTTLTTGSDNSSSPGDIEISSQSYDQLVKIWSTDGNATVLKKVTIEAPTPSGPSVSSFTPVSGSKLKTGATVTVAGSDGSTVYCLWASSAQTASAIKSGTEGSSGVASVTSAGIASANGTTLYAVAVKDATDSDVSSATYTIDDTAPTLSSSTPANGANNIPLSGNIVLTFNENVTINDASKFTISPSAGVTLSTGSATASSNTVTIPYSGLSSATTYTFSSDAGAVKDEAGNTSAALSDIAFTTYRCAVTSCGNADITYAINGGSEGSHSTEGADLISSATPSNPTALGASTTPTYTIISMSDLTKKAAATSNYCSETPNMSGKIAMYNGSSYSSSNYLQFTFTVKSGYTFTPCDIQFVVQPVSYEGHFRWEITDGSSSYGYGTGSAGVGKSAGATVLTGLSSTSEMEAGTYYIRLYPYYNGSNTFRIGEDVILRGTTAEAAPSCTAPTSPSVTSTNWIYVPGEEIELTASATGTDASTTYTWYKGATLETAKAAGAIQAAKTSAEGGTTYTCSASDAYRYWCVISNGTGCEASASYDIKIYKFYLYDNTGGDVSDTAFTTIDRTNKKISVDVALANAAYTYQFKVTDGMGTWYGKDETTITSGTAYADGLTSSGANVGLTSTGGGCDYTIEYYYNSNNVVVTYPATTYDITHSAATNGSYTIQIGSGAAVSTDTKSCDGSTITLAATPSSGYSLSSWSVTETDGGNAVDMATANTFVMPAKDVTIGASFACVTPTFGTNLSTSQVDYDKNASASALTVAATAGGGTVTYQWYSNDENNTDSPTTLTNCTTATYNPSTAATGTTYYYCVATNSTAGCSTTATSNIAKIVVSETSYTVTYNANGGSSAPSNDTGTDITLDDGSGMTGPSGRTTFMGWNTQADGYGTGYAGGTTAINANLDLYAIWGNTYSTGHVFAHDDSYRIVDGVRKNPAAGAVVTTDGTATAISNGSSILKSSVTGLTDVTISGCTSEYKTSYPWLASYIKIPTGQTLTFTVTSGYIGTATIYYSGYNKTTTLTNGATSQSITSDKTNPESAEGNFTSKTFNLASGTNTFTCSDNNGYISRIEVSMTQLYTLTLDKNNSDASGSSAGSAYVEPNGISFISGFTAPTRMGYDVEGYYGEAGCTTKIATAAGALQASKSVSDVEYTNSSSQWTKGSGATLYANWTPAVYNITYKDCGDVSFSGVHGDGYPTTHTYGTATALVDPTKEGCEFLGWFTDAAGTSSAGASIGETARTADFTLYAKWGVTIDESDFYQLYAMESKTRDQLITAASLPSYISTNITADAANTTFASAPTLTTPHDFSAIGTTKNYHIKTANTNTITITAVANVKTVRLYGYGSSKTVTATAINQSGGSNLSISNGTIDASGKVVEASFNISGASGYSSSAYYTITLAFPGDVHLFGVYIETASVYPVTGVSLNKSSTTLTAGDTEQLTATISPANATNKGLSWESSNTDVATVSSSGLITAEAEGETTITITTSDGSYTATCDVTVEAFSCAKFVGKIFELTVTTSSTSYTIGGGTEQSLSSDATIMDDCSAYMGKLGSSTSAGCISSTKLKLDVSSNNDKYAKITPKCALRNGDVISCTGSSQEIAFSTTKEKVSAPKTSSYSYTVTPGDGLAGASTIYVWGATSSATVATLTITRPTSYVMTYNPNGGRDEVDAERLAAGANTLTTDIPTRAGYIFKEWNTSEGGDGTGYAPGAAYTMGSADAELYAKWVTPTAGEMVYASVTMTAKNTATTVNGTGLVSNVGQSDDDDKSGYKLNSSSSCYFGITLANGNFKENDKIVVDVVAKGTTLDLCKATDGASFYQFTSLTNGTDYKGDNALQMTITADMVNPSGSVKLTNTIAIKRTGTSPFNISHFVRSIKVYREICPGCMALKSGVTTWSTTASNWIGPDGTAAAMPGIDDVVYVDKNITVTSNAAKAKDVILGDGKSLTITPTGGLVVAGTVTTSGGSATTPSDLVIESSAAGTGALITGERSTTTQAGVQFYSKARYASGYVNQFIGVPLASMTTYNGFYGTALYVYNSTSDAWQLLGNNAAMYPFTAYNLMRKETSAGTLYMEGALNLPGVDGTQTLEMGTRVGDYLFANSWTAPIDVKALDAGDFSDANATIYIFNAGTKSDYDGHYGDEGDDDYTTYETSNPGQWLYMPVSAVKESPEDFSLTVIPSMQAFMVKSTAANARLTLDYEKHVYNPAKTSGATIVPSRAPRRAAAEEDTKPEIVRIRVEGTNGYADDLLLFLREDFSTGYDNGWEAFKVAGKAFAPQLYAITEDGKKAISAQPDAENTVIGFKAGTEDDVYTFTLDYEGNDASLYLYDTYTDVYVRVEKDATYTFLTSDNEDHARFVLTSRNAPSVTTGVGNVPSDQVPSTKARKLMIDGILYIIREGRIYTVEGALVK